MSVEVTYSCNGCDAVAMVSGLCRQCRVDTPTIESAAPEGWMPFDPYTGVCYCPACWASIEAHREASSC